MNKQLSESEALHKIIRLFVVQYLANVHNYKNVQNQAINMLATYIARVVKELVLEMKRLLIMQGRTEPNCLHLLVAIKKALHIDMQKLCAFVIQKRQILLSQKVKIIQVPAHIFLKYFLLQYIETISKVFENDYQLANRYEKEKHYPTIRIMKSPYIFNLDDQNQCLPFRCGIDEAFNKPAQFTYKSTVEKIQREKKNIENLVAYTRRQNRKALGLYLDSHKQEEIRPKKKAKLSLEQDQHQTVGQRGKMLQKDSKQSKEFDFIGFL